MDNRFVSCGTKLGVAKCLGVMLSKYVIKYFSPLSSFWTHQNELHSLSEDDKQVGNKELNEEGGRTKFAISFGCIPRPSLLATFTAALVGVLHVMLTAPG